VFAGFPDPELDPDPVPRNTPTFRKELAPSTPEK
jgi:hypothetical protein